MGSLCSKCYWNPWNDKQVDPRALSKRRSQLEEKRNDYPFLAD